MNRTFLVAATVVVALSAFAAAAFFVSRDPGTPELAGASVEGTVSTVVGANGAAADAAPPPADHLVREHSPILGDPDAPVTVVEFFDPACEACRAFHPTVKSLVEDNPGLVRVVVRYTPFHGEASETAIALLEAARQQDMFEPVLEALLDNQPEWASHDAPAAERTLTIAENVGLDVEAARTWMMSPMTVGVINADRADVEAVGVRATPTFFVNDRPLAEFGQDELIEAVEREIEAVRGS